VAQQYGLKWGGDWRKPDTMHFQVDKSIDAPAALQATSAKLADSASAFQTDFSDVIGGKLIGGMASVADAAKPGLGGVVSTLMQALSGGEGGGGGGIGSFFSSIFGGGGGGDAWAGMRTVGNNANGTDNWRGGLTWTGERGPELLNLPRGSQVIPNHKLDRVMGSQQSKAAEIYQTFVNAPEVASQTEETDSRGNRHQRVVFKQAVADASGPGTPAFRKMQRGSNLRPTPVT
jgi:hypothetical protein